MQSGCFNAITHGRKAQINKVKWYKWEVACFTRCSIDQLSSPQSTKQSLQRNRVISLLHAWLDSSKTNNTIASLAACKMHKSHRTGAQLTGITWLQIWKQHSELLWNSAAAPETELIPPAKGISIAILKVKVMPTTRRTKGSTDSCTIAGILNTNRRVWHKWIQSKVLKCILNGSYNGMCNVA